MIFFWVNPYARFLRLEHLESSQNTLWKVFDAFEERAVETWNSDSVSSVSWYRQYPLLDNSTAYCRVLARALGCYQYSLAPVKNVSARRCFQVSLNNEVYNVLGAEPFYRDVNAMKENFPISRPFNENCREHSLSWRRLLESFWFPLYPLVFFV